MILIYDIMIDSTNQSCEQTNWYLKNKSAIISVNKSIYFQHFWRVGSGVSKENFFGITDPSMNVSFDGIGIKGDHVCLEKAPILIMNESNKGTGVIFVIASINWLWIPVKELIIRQDSPVKQQIISVVKDPR